jgi:agmatine/peptidylarginine deiminase
MINYYNLLFPFLLIYSIVAHTQNAVPEKPRAMAEWEEVVSVVINWGDFVWQDNIDQGMETPVIIQQNNDERRSTSELISEISNVVKVYVIDSRNGAAEEEMLAIGTDLSNVEIIDPPNPLSIWTRDYGPFTVYEQGNQQITLVNTKYFAGTQEISDSLVKKISVPYYDISEEPEQLVYDGGNFLTDGYGRLFMDSTTIPFQTSLENYKPLLEKAFGITEVIPFDRIDYHIDYYMKLINEETFLVSVIQDGLYIPPNYNMKVSEAVQYIKDNLKTPFGRDYEFVYIETPPEYDNTEENFTSLSNNMTYVNSLIVNDHVFVPVYGFEPYDSIALAMYDSIMPGYTIVPVNYLSWSARAGSIHCVTREIGTTDPIYISHKWLKDTINASAIPPAEAEVFTPSGVKQVNLHYSTDTTEGYQIIEMVNNGNGKYSSPFPEIAAKKVFYYLSAESNSGKTWKKPAPGSRGPYSFYVKQTVSVIEPHALNGIKLFQNHPNPFTEATHIRFELADGMHGNVRLTLHDVTGKKIKVLYDKDALPGMHKITINPDGLSAGIYFYKLKYKSLVKTKKMVIAPF